MTDLVQKLVVALEECLDDSHQVLAQMEQMYGMNYRQDRLESQRQVIAAAEAALSEAKAGGWVAVPERTTGDAFENAIRRYGVVAACEWFGHAHDSEFTKETQRVLDERLQPLPAPPAQKEPT